MNTLQTGNASMQKVLYTAKTLTKGGRDGYSKSADGRLDIQLTSPGAPGAGTNPEQLFAAGWSACFIGAMGFAAKNLKVKLPADTTVETEVDLGTGEDGYLLQARLNVHLPGIEKDIANEIIRQAHQTCPYSKATKGNIHAEIRVVE